MFWNRWNSHKAQQTSFVHQAEGWKNCLLANNVDDILAASNSEQALEAKDNALETISSLKI